MIPNHSVIGLAAAARLRQETWESETKYRTGKRDELLAAEAQFLSNKPDLARDLNSCM